MIRVTSIILVKRTPKRGVFDDEAIREREVFAEMSSVGYREQYVAMANGLRPSMKFKLRADREYDDEQQLRHDGKLYRIIHTYLTNDGGIELTVERDEENA